MHATLHGEYVQPAVDNWAPLSRARYESKCELMSKDKVYRDELGRKRNYWPRTGNLTVYLYASLFHSSTSAMHAAHLQEILQPIVNYENKGAVTIICDRGPDWSTKFTPNLISYGQLWKSKLRCSYSNLLCPWTQ